MLLPAMLLAQEKTITGTVADENGKPVPSATVSIRNKATHTITGEDGRFQLNAAAEDVLVISSINFETQEITVGSNISLAVTLRSQPAQLSDVVVVGYGTQKRKNVTGAVSSIGANEIDNRPVTNASSALAGLAPGVSVRQGSGDPRGDGATIRIRGTGTLNNSTPLFLVDGIQVSSIDQVNPNDIESISLLKDAASASIYGALGANGVVLVTTKKGTRGKTSVSYTGLFSFASPTGLLKLSGNSVDFMRLTNESAVNLGLAPIYSQANINAWDSAGKIPNQLNPNGIPNYVAYPNTDWFEETFERNLVQNHNISVSGGGEKSSFLLSLGYLNNPGTLPNTGAKRYQLRANVEARPAKFLTIGTQTFASVFRAEKGNADNYFNFLWQSTPTVYPYYNGKYGGKVADADPVTANNPLRLLFSDGGRNLTTRLNSTVYANLNLFKGFSIESRFNYQAAFAESNSYPIPLPRWNIGANTQIDPDPAAGLATASVSYSFNKSYSYTLDEILRYNTTIANDHEVGAFLGYNEYYANGYDFSAVKQALLDYSIYTFNGATTPTQASGGESDRSLRSVFGRLNYAYRSKYLFEGNFRRDGTSQFAPTLRWGNYTSFSAGWVVSEENFFAAWKDRVRNLKLRASWGTLGNNRVDDYVWQATYGPVPYSFNGTQVNGIRQSIFANPNLLWETTEAANIGIDMTLLNGNLDLSIEGYKKRTYDILIPGPGIPLTAGTRSAPVVNGPEMVNKGVEFIANWRTNISEVKLSIGGNFTYNNNEVTRYKGKFTRGFTKDANGRDVYTSNQGAVFSDVGSSTPVVEDYIVNEYFLQTVYKGNGTYFNSDGSVNIHGGPKDGMIRTAKDLDWVKAMIAKGYKFAPVQTVGKAQLYYGDLIYADNNGDSTYGNTHDRMFMGNSATPRFLFGFTLNASWKGFDLSMLWAGAAGMKYYWNQNIYNNTVTRLGNNISERVADNRYYYNDSNPDDPANRINGSLPRLKYITDNINGVASDFWLYDASYFRLKNLQIGYTVPQRMAKKAFVTNARIFLSGENLLTITSFPGLDPEIGANVGYPTMKQFAAGVNITF